MSICSSQAGNLIHPATAAHPTTTDSLDGESLDSQDWMELAHQGYLVEEEPPMAVQEHDVPTMIEIERDTEASAVAACKWDDEDEETSYWGRNSSFDDSMEDSKVPEFFQHHHRLSNDYGCPPRTIYHDATIQYRVA
mmetsp:Transcript_26432/g.76199  ORF Transcript_26432/g.76199 Transcript_26432/m.76199 type:complete len:137 (-) Transcript_26432:207-617(-)